MQNPKQVWYCESRNWCSKNEKLLATHESKHPKKDPLKYSDSLVRVSTICATPGLWRWVTSTLSTRDLADSYEYGQRPECSMFANSLTTTKWGMLS